MARVRGVLLNRDSIYNHVIHQFGPESCDARLPDIVHGFFEVMEEARGRGGQFGGTIGIIPISPINNGCFATATTPTRTVLVPVASPTRHNGSPGRRSSDPSREP
jgi:hypothetical protein